MSTKGHITLWPRDPGNSVKVPNVPPRTGVKAPLLAVFWANSATKIRRGRRRIRVGVVRARSYTIFGSAIEKRVLRSLNFRIRWLFRTRYNAKWAFIVKWMVTPYATRRKPSVSRTLLVFTEKTRNITLSVYQV